MTGTVEGTGRSHGVAPAMSHDAAQVALGRLAQQLAQVAQALVQAAAALPADPADGFQRTRGTGTAPAGRAQREDVGAARAVPFYSQGDAAHVPGAGPDASYRACRAMAQAVGVRMAAGPGDFLEAGSPEAWAYLFAQLAGGRPVTAGVESAGMDRLHYVLLTGVEAGARGETVYRFHDPALAGPEGAGRVLREDGLGALVHRDDAAGTDFRLARVVCNQGDKMGLAAASGEAGHVRLGYGPHARPLSPAAEARVRALLASAGVTEARLSSTTRTPEEQARAMLQNIAGRGVASQRALYAAPGQRVVDLAARMQAAGAPREAVLAAMAAQIRAEGPGHVSAHCRDGGGVVFDLEPGCVRDGDALVAAVEQARRAGQVKTFLHPGNSDDPAYHLELRA